MSSEFDLHIVLPVSATKEKYSLRFLDFQKYGLWNIGNRKVFVTLLIGTESPDLFVDNWHPNVTVEKISSIYDEAGSKTYDYYANLTNPPDARWHAKIDDDSLNDVDYLLTKFSENYIEEDALYLVTRIQRDCDRAESVVIRGMGYHHKWFKGITYTQHEHEGCFLTKKTLQLIVNNPICRDAFTRRTLIRGGYTDQCLAVAARVVGVHPIKSYFLCSEDEPISGYSAFGGMIGHFHPICRDKNEKVFNLVVRRLEEVSEFDKVIADTDCWICIEFGEDKRHFEFLLHKDHGIFRADGPGMRHGEVECLWFTSDENLEIYNDRGDLLVKFNCHVSPLHAASHSLLNDKIKYTIHKKL